MILNGSNSRRLIVNLFSEFILNKFSSESLSLIDVADCENFFVIKGKTNQDDVLDIGKIKDEFLDVYSKLLDIKLFQTIDLIEYSQKLNPINKLELEFYNSENVDYTQTQLELYKIDNKKSYNDSIEIKDSLININNFPHNVSIKMGRLLYYYGKHITYNIPTNYPFNKVVMIIKEKSVEIYKDDERDLTLESAVLDMFDFEMGWMINEIEKVNLSQVILNPLNDFEFLKRKIKNFFIV